MDWIWKAGYDFLIEMLNLVLCGLVTEFVFVLHFCAGLYFGKDEKLCFERSKSKDKRIANAFPNIFFHLFKFSITGN